MALVPLLWGNNTTEKLSATAEKIGGTAGKLSATAEKLLNRSTKSSTLDFVEGTPVQQNERKTIGNEWFWNFY